MTKTLNSDFYSVQVEPDTFADGMDMQSLHVGQILRLRDVAGNSASNFSFKKIKNLSKNDHIFIKLSLYVNETF